MLCKLTWCGCTLLRADPVCLNSRNEKLLADIKLQHKKECKGLMVQIRFLKARFTREEGLRTCLVEQKRYLLVLLARSERKCVRQICEYPLF